MQQEWRTLHARWLALRKHWLTLQRLLNAFPEIDETKDDIQTLRSATRQLRDIRTKYRDWQRWTERSSFPLLPTEKVQQEHAWQDKIVRLEEAIVEVRARLQASKTVLEKQAAQVTAQISRQERREVEWSSLSPNHLQFIRAEAPSRYAAAQKLFCQKNPTVVKKLLNGRQAARSDKKSSGVPVPRKQRPSKSVVLNPSSSQPVVLDQPWRFIFMNDAATKGWALVSDPDKAQQQVQKKVVDLKLHALDSRLVMERLTFVVALGRQRRNQLKRSLDTPPKGWRIMHLGYDYRIFLDIDENKRIVRFIVRARSNAYSTIGHSC